MKQLILTIVILYTGTSLCAQNTASFESAWKAVEHMRLGWGIGNTLDSHSGDTLRMWIESNKNRTVTSYETAWGQKVTQASLFKLFKEAGFNAIRIPVTWYPHMEATFKDVRGYDNKGTWSYTPWLPSKDDIGTKIQTAWMERVKQMVDYVIAQDMYCILNIHHDTGADNTAWLIAGEKEYAAQRERFEAIWTQIAEVFRDYDEHLLFEGYNEMLDVKRSWCFASFAAQDHYDAAIASSAYNAINAYAQSFVDAVRATGGNNAQRNLIVSTYGACNGAGNWNAHLLDPLKEMRLPDDPAGEGHLLFEVHSYPDVTNLDNAKKEILTNIGHLKEYLVKKGAPVIFGEWGTSTQNAYEKKHDNLLAFSRFFVEQAKQAGMATFSWMGLSDGAHRTVPEFNQPDLVDAIAKGYYGEGGYADGIQPVFESSGRGFDKDNTCYDLSGRHITNSTEQSGIIITNGKKVIRQ